MRSFLFVLIILTSGSVLKAQAPGATAGDAKSATASAPAGNAQNGKKLFESYGCYECHDRDAHGGAGTGPRLAPNPIPFAALLKYVRHPAGDMPPYTAKVVSDQELVDIYAFLRTIPAPPSLKSIPILNK